jgi:hypothetical protein
MRGGKKRQVAETETSLTQHPVMQKKKKKKKKKKRKEKDAISMILRCIELKIPSNAKPLTPSTEKSLGMRKREK